MIFGQKDLKSNDIPRCKYIGSYTYNGVYTYKTNTKKQTAAYEQSVKCLENAGKQLKYKTYCDTIYAQKQMLRPGFRSDRSAPIV